MNFKCTQQLEVFVTKINAQIAQLFDKHIPLKNHTNDLAGKRAGKILYQFF